MKSTSRYRFSSLQVVMLAVVALCFVIGAISTVAAGPSKWDKEAAVRKANYIFMRAAEAFATDENDAAYILVSRAAELNPADVDLLAQQATYELGLLDNPDSATIARGYQRMRDGWNANQTDYLGGSQLASIAKALRDYDECIRIWSTLDSLFPAKTDPAVNLAESYLYRYAANNDTASFNQALSIYHRLKDAAGPDLGLSSQIIRAYSLRNDTASIRLETKKLLSELPKEPTAWLFAGAVSESYGNDSLTEQYYRQAAAIDSTDGRAFQQLANYYRQRNDSVAYDREVFNALQSSNLDFETKYDIMRGYLTELYSDTTQWARIEHLFQILDQVNPGEPGMHQLQAVFEASRGNLEQAREQFGYTVALNPTDVESYQTLVRLDVSLDKLDDAVRNSRRAMEIFPDNLLFPILAATALEQQDSLDAALKLLRSVDVTDVRNAKAVSNFVTVLGDCYYKAGMHDSAFVQYERAIKLDSENFGCYNNCAYFMAESDTALDKAERYAQFAVLSDPHNPTYLDTYAWVYFKKHDYQNAKIQINEALDAYGYLRPGSPFLADSLDIDTFVVAVNEDVSDKPTSVTNEGTSTAVDTVDEEYEETMQILQPEQPSTEILSHAGDIYFMCGEPEEALKFWEAALEQSPDDEMLQRKVKHKTYFYK